MIERMYNTQHDFEQRYNKGGLCLLGSIERVQLNIQLVLVITGAQPTPCITINNTHTVHIHAYSINTE